MNRYGPYSLILAVSLSGLAGYIDVVGFIELGGYFISFMSGNSTRFAVAFMEGDWAHVILIGTILCCFISGAILGTLVGHRAGESHQAFAVMRFVTILLLVALTCYEAGFALPAILVLTLAMGAENTVFQSNGDIAIGLTYMTGTLVKCGQRIAYALLGDRDAKWQPYLALWLGLVGGGIIGVALFHLLKLRCLWLAVIWAGCITFLIRNKKT